MRGRSMLPALREGDLLLVRYAARVRPGDLVVARFVDGTLAVKRAVEQRGLRDGRAGWWLLSDNPGEGVDSRHRGPVATDDVLGVVRLRLWPSPRVGRRLRSR
ncbi:S24/S26 family peptidase [Nocardioides okcheonensis]|uniref:S24/S26 family peptidase n=1 Tax=Nocardioides okcheonensis TaxID=2894081 RepID=UPI001E317D41|nr:S24/S26 family peptidase [Nocardioides okcheonensis]UFN44279.1 S24/S26 family peptidase [Nocardioides okcheonensis]